MTTITKRVTAPETASIYDAWGKSWGGSTKAWGSAWLVHLGLSALGHTPRVSETPQPTLPSA